MSASDLAAMAGLCPAGQPRAAVPTWFVPRRVMGLGAVVETLEGRCCWRRARGPSTAYLVRVREPNTALDCINDVGSWLRVDWL